MAECEHETPAKMHCCGEHPDDKLCAWCFLERHPPRSLVLDEDGTRYWQPADAPPEVWDEACKESLGLPEGGMTS